MIPLLAPLLGSLAGSLLPATLGSGIAGALGLKGAAGALVASAAPKAIGAGIGTLLAGGDLGDAALNAVGFGAAGALLGGAGSTGAPATSSPPYDAPRHALVVYACTSCCADGSNRSRIDSGTAQSGALRPADRRSSWWRPAVSAAESAAD
jgi:hypothetical protein